MFAVSLLNVSAAASLMYMDCVEIAKVCCDSDNTYSSPTVLSYLSCPKELHAYLCLYNWSVKWCVVICCGCML